MSKQKIIAFYSPYTQAGKSTAADYINTGNHRYWKASFAEPLYEIVHKALWYGLSNDKYNLYFHNKDKSLSIPELNGASVRDFLITFGQAAKKLYPDIWVDCMRRFIECNQDENFVIDDLRFPNEYAMLREKGAKIIRITNPDREIVLSDTEALLEGYVFDYQLVNSKNSIEEYKAQIDALLASIKGDDGHGNITRNS